MNEERMKSLTEEVTQVLADQATIEESSVVGTTVGATFAFVGGMTRDQFLDFAGRTYDQATSFFVIEGQRKGEA